MEKVTKGRRMTSWNWPTTRKRTLRTAIHYKASAMMGRITKTRITTRGKMKERSMMRTVKIKT